MPARLPRPSRRRARSALQPPARWCLGLGVAVAGLAACSGGGAAKPVPTTDAGPGLTETVSTPTTTTPPPVVGTAPLTGLPSHDLARLARPALSVKVDNAQQARPQSGLNQADLVTEALVEGGVTRFLATFQSEDSTSVGPVRSARPVDADLLRELGGGLFVYSGAAAGEIAPVIDHSNAILLTDTGGFSGLTRSAGRYPPFNLYGSTPALYAVGAKAAADRKLTPPAPPALFSYSAQPTGGTPAGGVQLSFSGHSSAGWTWDATSHQYSRVENGTFHVLADGTTVTADDVVILSVAIQGTGIFDQSHNEDPLVVVVGSGPCWVLRDGMVSTGTWQRPTYRDQMTLLGADGQPLTLRPGRTWLELLPLPSQPALH